MDIQAQKVNKLLSIFQGSLFNHMISMSSNRDTSPSYLGYIPDIHIEEVALEESITDANVELESNNEAIINESNEENIEIPLIPMKLHKHGKTLKKKISGKNDLVGFMTITDGQKKSITEAKDLELEYEEIGKVQIKQKYSTAPKVLQRLLNNTEINVKPARYTIPEDSKEESTQPSLYGEVIAATYSQGGDGFALHPGDFVNVLQFLNEFGLVECKWQGLKGLFPQDKIKLMTRPSHSLNSSISSIISKQFMNRPAVSESLNMSKSSKLAHRLLKKSYE